MHLMIGGLGAIVLNSSSGHHSSLSEDKTEEVKVDVLTHSRDLGYEFSNWEGKSVVRGVF